MLEEYFDSVSAGPGIWKWRHYFPAYERHLAKFRHMPVNVLEVGVYGGGSLQMWHHYFGAHCHVYGVDINPAAKIHEDNATTILIGDQADPKFWADMLPRVASLNVVIDDGGHQTHQQITTFESVLPHVAPGGIYVVEDIYGIDNELHTYLSVLSRRLCDRQGTSHPVRIGSGQTIPTNHVVSTNDWQKRINSIHMYPFLAVIETRTEPLHHLLAPRHGTEWPDL